MNAIQDTIADDYVAKVENRTAVIGVIGLGYVGLPLVLSYAEKGFKIVAFDIDQKKTDAISSGKTYIKHIGADRIATAVETGRVKATTNPADLAEADALLICVPTPLSTHREPDVSFIESTVKMIAPVLRRGQLIVLESTTYPGTSRDLMVPILSEGSGLEIDKDFYIAYSPEREDPGNEHFDTTTIPKVVGASSPTGLRCAEAVYKALTGNVVPIPSLETAEAVKLTENIFRAVNIALVNELKVVFDEMGIDVWKVIDAASTKPFGFMPFYPGPGIGGHCIPVDPFYLTWKAREYGMHTRFIELAGEINAHMPQYVINRLTLALSDNQQKSLKGAKILVVGIAYKKNVDDMRESPALILLELLKERGAEISYYDPYIPVIPMTREHPDFAGIKSVAGTAEDFAAADAALVVTEHSNVDWLTLVENSKMIVDTRNALKDFADRHPGKIIRA